MNRGTQTISIHDCVSILQGVLNSDKVWQCCLLPVVTSQPLDLLSATAAEQLFVDSKHYVLITAVQASHDV